jgi:hypothetical protein
MLTVTHTALPIGTNMISRLHQDSTIGSGGKIQKRNVLVAILKPELPSSLASQSEILTGRDWHTERLYRLIQE